MVQALKKKVTILLLALYWLVLFVLTHIPMPDLVHQAGVSDKTLHFLAYLVLMFLLWGAIKPYQKVNWRRAAVWWLLFVVVGYGGVDEWLQGYVGRTTDLKDFLADLGGSATSLVLLSVLEFWPASLVVTAATVFSLNCLTRADLTQVWPVGNLVLHFFGYGLFTALWAYYRSLSRPGRWGRVPWTLVVPLGLLALIKLAAWTLDKRPAFDEIMTATAGIVMAKVLTE